ncbi:DNA cytosine methyltransferase [Enterocloster bolteae]|nr:DNA cytosine methyltransferase [Enterocloster bolteae]MCQ5144484.1 DNA cytosine methyltransferase [Enterocloster bolteae]
MLTMGSLFDGIGGFPLAAVHNGITPLWASEIEAFPIEVTKVRFPGMLHVGDITKLDGAKLPPVDVICGGSPCQDLSVAGMRRGLAGERSGLFMEQTRITKEMRKADEERGIPDHLIRPRYLVWENVPGAFSSAEGEDFRAVVEEILRIKDGAGHVPRPDTGRWESAGAAILGDQFSLAWRVLDAQYWGVAQRRRRIFLVADFGGRTAPQILFEQDRLFGDTAPCRNPRQGTAVPTEGGATDSGRSCLTPWDVQSRRISPETGTWPALYGGEGGGHGYIKTEEKTAIAAKAESVHAFHVNQRDEVIDLQGVSGALLATRNMQMQTFVTQEPLLCLNDQGGERMDITEEVTPTLRAGMGGHPPLVSQPGQGYPCVLTAAFCGNAGAEARGIGYPDECSPTIKTGTAPAVLCLNDQGGSQMHCTEDMTGTLRAQEHGHQPLVMATQPVLFENHGIDARSTGPHKVAPTMSARYGTGGNNVPLIAGEQETICIAGNTIDREPQNGGNGLGCQPDVAYTLTATDHHAVFSRQRSDEFSENGVVATQSARQHKDATDLICQPYQQTVGTIGYSDHKGVNNQFVSEDKCIVEKRNLIRRLTPLECERLQGFPDGWTLIPDASDSARYKALGNSVAIPCVDFVLRGIAYFLRRIKGEDNPVI